MERLISDANEYAAANGMAADLTIDSYADVIQAIQLVQEKQGVAGTTAVEASKTVSGSIGTMKAAWENWLTTLGTGGDMSAVTDQLLESVMTVANNLGPVIGTIASSLVAAAPTMLQAGIQMFGGLLQSLAAVGPQIGASIPTLIAGLVQAIVAGLPQIISGAIQLFWGIAVGLVQSIPTLVSTLLSLIPQLVYTLVASIPQMLAGALLFFMSIGKALNDAAEQIGPALAYFVTHLPEIVMNAIDDMAKAAGELFGTFMDSLTSGVPIVTEGAEDMASSAVEAAAENSDATAVGENMTSTMLGGWDFSAVDKYATEGAEGAVEAASNVDASQIGLDFSQAAASGIDVSAMTGPASEMAASASASMGDMSGAASAAATAFQDFASMVESAMDQAQRAADNAASRITNALSRIPSSKTVTVNVARGSVVLPHFSMYGDFDPKTKSVPHVSVSWWAKGGIFTQPAVIGVGEGREPEGVFPLSKLDAMMGNSGGVRDVNVYLDYSAGEGAAKLARDVARRLETILSTEA